MAYLDIADDFLTVADMTDAATYQVLGPEGDVQAEYPVTVLLQGMSEHASGFQSGLAPTTSVAHVAAGDLEGVVPGRGDRIVTESHGTWVVQTYELLAWRTRWQLTVTHLTGGGP